MTKQLLTQEELKMELEEYLVHARHCFDDGISCAEYAIKVSIPTMYAAALERIDELEEIVDAARDLAIGVHLDSGGTNEKALDIYAMCFNALHEEGADPHDDKVATDAGCGCGLA